MHILPIRFSPTHRGKSEYQVVSLISVQKQENQKSSHNLVFSFFKKKKSVFLFFAFSYMKAKTNERTKGAGLIRNNWRDSSTRKTTKDYKTWHRTGNN